MALTFKQYLLETSKLSTPELAKKLGVSSGELNKMTSQELQTVLKYVGEHDFAPDSEFDPQELAKGIKVELEHTNSTLIAKLIAKDHLKEDKHYYSKLAKVEKH